MYRFLGEDEKVYLYYHDGKVREQVSEHIKGGRQGFLMKKSHKKGHAIFKHVKSFENKSSEKLKFFKRGLQTSRYNFL